jgi:hypothetical protein
MLTIFLFSVVYTTAFEKNYYNQQHFGEFKDITATVHEWHSRYGSGNITQAIRTVYRKYLDFYFNKKEQKYEFEKYKTFNRKDFIELKEIVENSKTPFFLFGWTMMGSYITEDIIKAKYPCIVEEKKFSGLSYIALYSTDTSRNCIEEIPVVSFSSDFSNGDYWNFNSDFIIDTLGGSAAILSGIEYGPTFQKKIIEINNGKIEKVRIKYKAFSNEVGDAQMVVSYDTKDSPAYEWMSTNIDYFQKNIEWFDVIHTFKLPEYKSKDDVIKIYLWNVNKSDIIISDLKIEFFETEY